MLDTGRGDIPLARAVQQRSSSAVPVLLWCPTESARNCAEGRLGGLQDAYWADVPCGGQILSS